LWIDPRATTAARRAPSAMSMRTAIRLTNAVVAFRLLLLLLYAESPAWVGIVDGPASANVISAATPMKETTRHHSDFCLTCPRDHALNYETNRRNIRLTDD
jgi:hypothetical protein